MNAEIKKLWTDALRSGEYSQGRSGLCINKTYCCLGVLCDLHSKISGTAWSGEDKCKLYMNNSCLLPKQVVAWAELESATYSPVGIASYNVKIDSGQSLASLNDFGVTFNEIADLIEKHL